MENQKFTKHQNSCRDCEECIAGYPTLCSCGGLIHSEYGVNEEKGKFVTTGPFLNCDRCGSKFMKHQQAPRRRGRAHHNGRNNQRNESAGGRYPRV
jgi:hypothetical protein